MCKSQEPQSSIDQDQSDQQRRTVGATAAVLASTLAEAFPNAGNHKKAGRKMAEDMGKAGFTPGPWECARMLLPPGEKDRRCGFVVNGPENDIEKLATRVCDLRVPCGWSGFSEGEANARLIAAAPDLYAACKELLVQVDPCPNDVPMSARCRVCGCHPTKHERDCVVLTARAALAKARGT